MRISPVEIRLILKYNAANGAFVSRNSSCPSCSSWLIAPVYAGRPQNAGATRANDGHRASPAFGFACSGHGHFENLAGSAVRRRAAGRERLLLRCRSSPPDFAGGFREDRSRDEKRDQSESSVRKDGRLARRSARARKKRTARRAERP